MNPATETSSSRFGGNAMVTLAAILVSVCALAVSVYQAKIMRDTQQASVWPFVEVLPSNSQRGAWLGVTNKGIGPAIIQTVQVEIDGNTYQTWQEIFDDLMPNDSLDFVWSSVTGRVLAPNEEVRAIQMNPADARRIGGVMQQMKFEVCYCSVYGTCWQTDLGQQTEAIDACEGDPERSFQ